MSALHLRRPRLLELLVLATPALLGMLACGLVRPEPGLLVAPLLGPWGGTAFGHRDCTVASFLPGWSIALLVAGGALAAGLALAPRGRARIALVVLALAWLAAWEAAAVVSVINSTE